MMISQIHPSLLLWVPIVQKLCPQCSPCLTWDIPVACAYIFIYICLGSYLEVVDAFGVSFQKKILNSKSYCRSKLKWRLLCIFLPYVKIFSLHLKWFTINICVSYFPMTKSEPELVFVINISMFLVVLFDVVLCWEITRPGYLSLSAKQQGIISA